MPDFTDVFDDTRLTPTEFGFESFTITTDTQAYWPLTYAGSGIVLAKINNFLCGAGNKLLLPPAGQVSSGTSFLLCNKGSNTLAVHAADGSFIASIPATQAQMFYVTGYDSTSASWNTLVYGAVSASVNSADLAGNGNASIGGKLASSVSTVLCAGSITVLDSHRAQLLDFVSSASVITLLDITNYSAGFFCYLKNSSANSITIAVDASDTIEASATVILQPGESSILFNNGSADWVLVGRGRSTVFQYNSLTLDVSAGGTFTLSAAQASNKMLLFIGNPSGTVNVVVPNVVSVYYAANSLSTAQSVRVKTSAGVGSPIPQSQRAVLLCDGSDVSSAQTAPTIGVQSMLNGTESAPSLNFSSQTNTGLYKYSTVGIGLSANGVAQLVSNGAGVAFPSGISDDVVIVGSGKRIKGDFSNATIANRALFQNSNVNANSTVEAIPNGTGVSASWQVSNNGNDPANASIANLFINATEVRLQSTQRGTGTYLPLSFYTGGSFGMQLDSAHNLGVNKVPSGAAGYNFIEQAAHATNGGGYRLFSSNGAVEALRMYTDGAGTLGYVFSVANVPLMLGSNNTERLRFSGLGEWGLNGTNYGTLGQTIVSQGAGSPPVWGSPVTRAATVPTTSGTSIDITGIPSFAKRITICEKNVSTSGASRIILQIGSASGGVDTTSTYSGCGGYVTNSTTGAMVTDTTGFYLESLAAASNSRSGVYVLTNMSGNDWILTGMSADSAGPAIGLGSGIKTLSSTLDRIRLTTIGGIDTFDAGSINVFWE